MLKIIYWKVCFCSGGKICLGKSLPIYLAHNIHMEYYLDCLELKISEIIRVISLYHGWIFRIRNLLIVTHYFHKETEYQTYTDWKLQKIFSNLIYSRYQITQLQFIIILLPLQWIHSKDRNKSNWQEKIQLFVMKHETLSLNSLKCGRSFNS